MENNWAILCEFINQFNIGDTIKRSDIKSHFKDKSTITSGSLDSYRNYLTQAGYICLKFIDKKRKIGEYVLLKKISNDLSVNKCVSEAYDNWENINKFTIKNEISLKIRLRGSGLQLDVDYKPIHDIFYDSKNNNFYQSNDILQYKK